MQTIDFLKFSKCLENSYSYHIWQFLDFQQRFFKRIVNNSSESYNFQIVDKLIKEADYDEVADSNLEYFCGSLDL